MEWGPLVKSYRWRATRDSEILSRVICCSIYHRGSFWSAEHFSVALPSASARCPSRGPWIPPPPALHAPCCRTSDTHDNSRRSIPIGRSRASWSGVNRAHRAHGLRAHSRGRAGSRTCSARRFRNPGELGPDSIEKWRMGSPRIARFCTVYKKGTGVGGIVDRLRLLV
jgi:hypothetical protein